LLSPFPPSLETQVAAFLAQSGSVAPGDALYVVAGGGNDARDALTAIAGCGGNAICVAGAIESTATAYATNIGTIVGELEFAGARSIIVWDTPDVGKSPAVVASGGAAIGSLVASSMNSALLLTGIGADPDVKLFDIYGLVDEVVANPGAFGLANVTDACAQFDPCDPSQYFFWDGIHPTSAGQTILSEAMLRSIPEPTTLALLGVALAGVRLSRLRRAKLVEA
jgi:phospholipase/lecithinase/hemolysin